MRPVHIATYYAKVFRLVRRIRQKIQETRTDISALQKASDLSKTSPVFAVILKVAKVF
jgi:hypothetical protein